MSYLQCDNICFCAHKRKRSSWLIPNPWDSHLAWKTLLKLSWCHLNRLSTCWYVRMPKEKVKPVKAWVPTAVCTLAQARRLLSSPRHQLKGLQSFVLSHFEPECKGTETMNVGFFCWSACVTSLCMQPTQIAAPRCWMVAVAMMKM